jgi:uncharacterized protein (DUF2147 family)
MGCSVKNLLLSLVVVLGAAFPALSQDRIEGSWYNEEKTAKVQVFKAKDNKFYGKIVWLRDPLKDGKPKTDTENPDAKKRSQPIMGLLLLKGFTKDGEDGYEDGTIYDPKNGKTYSCKMTLEGNRLNVRGYMGISLIGRTTAWTRAE